MYLFSGKVLGHWPIWCNWPTKTNMDYVGSNADLSNKSKIRKTKTNRSWLHSDPEVKRKKRVATYKVFSMEGKFKQSVRTSCRWLKAKYIEVRYGWWWRVTTTALERFETNLIIIVNNVQQLSGTKSYCCCHTWGKNVERLELSYLATGVFRKALRLYMYTHLSCPGSLQPPIWLPEFDAGIAQMEIIVNRVETKASYSRGHMVSNLT